MSHDAAARGGVAERRPGFRDRSRRCAARRLSLSRADHRVWSAPRRRVGGGAARGDGTGRCGAARHAPRSAAFGGSALTADIAVPQDRPHDQMSSGIPITYVPARNTVFLSLALAWAEVLESFDIFMGVNCHRLFGLSGLPAGIHRRLRDLGESGDESRRRRQGPFSPSHAADPADESGHHSPRRRAGRRLQPDTQLLRSRSRRRRLRSLRFLSDSPRWFPRCRGSRSDALSCAVRRRQPLACPLRLR